jgi:hypothetical protein
MRVSIAARLPPPGDPQAKLRSRAFANRRVSSSRSRARGEPLLPFVFHRLGIERLSSSSSVRTCRTTSRVPFRAAWRFLSSSCRLWLANARSTATTGHDLRPQLPARRGASSCAAGVHDRHLWPPLRHPQTLPFCRRNVLGCVGPPPLGRKWARVPFLSLARTSTATTGACPPPQLANQPRLPAVAGVRDGAHGLHFGTLRSCRFAGEMSKVLGANASGGAHGPRVCLTLHREGGSGRDCLALLRCPSTCERDAATDLDNELEGPTGGREVLPQGGLAFAV